jgi:hypothetical protein
MRDAVFAGGCDPEINAPVEEAFEQALTTCATPSG